MKPSSSLALISAGILATVISVVPMTSPAAAQTTTSPGTGTTGTTTTTYENNNDDRGLWGLTGLLGLFGLMGRRKEEHTNTRRDDAPVYRDPSIR
jgi:hypothetical protein